jgi:hypothetical protein
MKNTSENTPSGSHKVNIKQRVNSADLIVSGKVINVSKVEYKQNHPISRQDPSWNEATIQIEGVEKGTYDGNEIKVLFPQSDHISWYKIPKLGAGHEATYILHKENIPHLNNEEAYTVLHETDIQSKENVNQIKKLVDES